MPRKSNRSSTPFSFKAFLSHRYKSPLENLYFFNLFGEIAEVQFEVDEGLSVVNVTRLERMIRDCDAFIGIYPFPGAWKDAGIRVKINNMPSTQFWEVWTKVPFGFTGWTHRPLGTMVLGLAYRTGVPWNEAKYSNKDFDSLLTTAEGTLDVPKRREIMAKLEAILQDDGPIVQPLWRSVFTFMAKRVQGFKMHPRQKRNAA